MKGAPATAWMRSVYSGLWRALAVALALTSPGCQQAKLDESIDASPCVSDCGDMSSKWGREAAMNRMWQKRRLSELRTALGPPRMILNIPGGGSPPGFIAVYGVDPVTSCVDAFALVYDNDPAIRAYHCR